MSLSRNLALLFTLILVVSSLPIGTANAFDESQEYNGAAEQNWWDDWHRDTNHNKIDDLIEEMPREERFGIFINYDRHPNEEDVDRLSKFDMEVKYVYKYIDVICARNVTVSEVRGISQLPHVVMVKLEPKIYPALDVSARAIKARESSDYTPYTAADLDITGDNHSFSIAILDSGVDNGGLFPNQRHESLDDLDDDPTTNDEKFRAGVDFTQEESIFAPRDGSYDPDDTNGHGTHCAGIAMGTGGSDKQYVGMAPQAKLVDVRIGEAWGSINAGDSIAGIEWCIQHKDEFNIRVLSLSYGSAFGESDGKNEESLTVNNAVDAGLVVVAAIGNDGEKRVTSPAAADGAIAVGSIDDVDTVDRSDDVLSDFSNTGPRLDDGDDDLTDELKPDVVAYGDGITSAQANTQSGYITFSGTSMSTPHVAGVVALMLDANPSLNPEQVKMILRETAEQRGTPSFPDLDPKYNTDYGWGIVDAYKAVNMALGYREVNINIDEPQNWDIVKGEVTITGTASVDRGGVGLVEVSIDDPDFNIYTLTAEGKEEWSVTWDTEGWDGHRTIYAKATSGNYSAVASVTVVVENEDGSGAGDEILEEDGPPKINLPFGIGKVSIYAAAGFVAIVVGVVVLIVAAILLRRRRMYRELIAKRQYERGLR